MKHEMLIKFLEQGYIVQEPTKDKTLFLVKQENKGTILIFVKLYKKRVEIEAYKYSKNKLRNVPLSDNIHHLLLDYILDLGYTEYQITSTK